MPKIEHPYKLGRGLNDRGSPIAKARVFKKEKRDIGFLMMQARRPPLPAKFVLTRISPSAIPMDDDNLVGAWKAGRDAIAQWAGVDDGAVRFITFETRQERGPWGIRIEWGD